MHYLDPKLNVQMTVIGIEEAYYPMSLSPGEWSIRAGKRAVLPTSEVENSKTSW